MAKTEAGTGSIGEKDFHFKVVATLALLANDSMVASVRSNTKSFIGATRYQKNNNSAAVFSYSKTMQFESAIGTDNSGSGDSGSGDSGSLDFVLAETLADNFAKIDGVGTGTIKAIINAGLLSTMTVDYDGGFTKDTNWSGDATETVETVYCDKHFFDASKLDCYVFWLDNPTQATRLEAEIWQGKSSSSWVDLIGTKSFRN